MASTVLQDALQHKHEDLTGRLVGARSTHGRREQSQRGCPPIDLFLSGVSKHLHAVDAVLVPAARSDGADGAGLVEGYRPAAKELEVVLAHVKAHEYGSSWEASFDWDAIWRDVDEALDQEWAGERALAEHLDAELPDERLDELAGRLEQIEAKAPTRPHPYLPHTGAAGKMTRGLMRVADSFWDSVEGRFVPQVPTRPHKKPGLIGQYLMADPRWEEDEAANAPVAEAADQTADEAGAPDSDPVER